MEIKDHTTPDHASKDHPCKWVIYVNPRSDNSNAPDEDCAEVVTACVVNDTLYRHVLFVKTDKQGELRLPMNMIAGRVSSYWIEVINEGFIPDPKHNEVRFIPDLPDGEWKRIFK